MGKASETQHSSVNKYRYDAKECFESTHSTASAGPRDKEVGEMAEVIRDLGVLAACRLCGEWGWRGGMRSG